MTARRGPALEPLMTVKEVAAYLRVTPRFVRTLDATGKLPCIRIGAATRWVPAHVRAYVERLCRPEATVTALPRRETIDARRAERCRASSNAESGSTSGTGTPPACGPRRPPPPARATRRRSLPPSSS
ncbi:MAG: helix-turn-helix domain-containing protein [Archangiaceae bacterium]|nr:helix-turn-helix domain-containing protein [Archangiaceae bacterium]